MNTITLYSCEYCETAYGDKNTAEACEKNHKIARSIKDAKYQRMADDKSGYPLQVVIEFNDGTKKTYRRKNA